MTSDKELFHANCDDVECCALDSGLVDMTVPNTRTCCCAVRTGDEFEGDVSDICPDE